MGELPAVNASPLIYLARTELLDFLQVVAETVVVPNALTDEIRHLGPTDITVQALQNTAWVVRIDDPPIPRVIQRWHLGEGKSAVLAWEYIHPGTETITDDLAGRRCAAALRIPVRGLSVSFSQQRGEAGSLRPDPCSKDFTRRACTFRPHH